LTAYTIHSTRRYFPGEPGLPDCLLDLIPSLDLKEHPWDDWRGFYRRDVHPVNRPPVLEHTYHLCLRMLHAMRLTLLVNINVVFLSVSIRY